VASAELTLAVRMTIELRDLSSAKLERLGEKIKTRAAAIASETQTEISMTRAGHMDPALAAPEVQRAIEGAASRLGLQSRRLPSGAGHDAQMIGNADADGDDLHAQRRRNQPFTQGADFLAGLRRRCEYVAGDGYGTRPIASLQSPATVEKHVIRDLLSWPRRNCNLRGGPGLQKTFETLYGQG
jgi:hypothetical protein